MCWLAGVLANQAQSTTCIALHGEVGAGKSTFARAFIQALCGADVTVASPTFTLAQSYITHGNIPLWHYDLYRLEHASELEALGLEESMHHAITLIEWSGIAAHLLPAHMMHITIAFHENPDYRSVTIYYM